MTFARANPLGWGLLELLTSDQMNTIDTQLVSALDGSAGGTYEPSAPIIIEAPVGSPGFKVRVVNGSSPQTGLEVSGTVEGTWARVLGMSLNKAGAPAIIFESVGHANAGTGGGGIAILGTGGEATNASGTGGVGVYGWGGNADDGAGNGKGGTGVAGEGGLGGTQNANASDRGVGVVGFGAVGVLARVGSTNETDASFTPTPMTALHVVAREITDPAQASIIEFKGQTSQAAMNLWRWVGSATLPEVLCKMETVLTSGPASDVSTLLQLRANTTSGRVCCVDARGHEAVGIFADSVGTNTLPGLGIVPKAAQLTRFYPGGVTNMNVGVVTGLQSNALFYGTDQGSDGRYDRLVGSADSAAVWAWCRIDFDGAGPVLGTEYNVQDCAPSAVWEVDVNMKVTAGSGVNLCPTVSATTGAGGVATIVTVNVIDGNTVRISVFNHDGTTRDLSAISNFSLFLHVEAYPSGTRPANRPTYYSAAYP